MRYRTIIPATFVICTIASGCGPGPGDEQWTVHNGLIAFTRTSAGNADVYLQRGHDTVQVNLTNHPGQDHWASWSPDGSHIAFQSLRDGNREIYVVPVDGSHARNLTNDAAEDLLPAWSPDGSRIAFFSTRGEPRGPNGEFRGNIFTMNVDGSAVSRVTTEALQTSEAPAWSPDGRRIAFGRDGDLHLADVGGGDEVRLTSGEAYDGAPAFAPDGQRIVFYTQRGDDAVIAMVNLDGSARVELTQIPGQAYYPSWSPDGSMIAYTALGEDQYDIRVMNADGTGNVALVATDQDERRAVWAPARDPGPQ